VIARRDRDRGLLIAFEGPEGSGKTTQQRLLKTWLESEGRSVVSSRWASSPLVRPLIRARKKIRSLSAQEYSLLHAIDFRHRLEAVILPSLWAGKTVLADRYLFAALARDAARGLEFDWLLQVYSPLLWPDLVLYFSLPPDHASRRIAATRSPRYYESGQDVTGIDDPLVSYQRFVNRVVKEYDNLSVVFRFVKVDAGAAVYRQHQQVRALVQGAARRPWSQFSSEALEEWLARTSAPDA
jgi:dTMP kinase